MTKKELYKMDFEDAIYKLQEERDDIHSEETLLEMAKNEIDNNNLYMALHILHGITDDIGGEYYCYDRTMGTLENLTPLNTIEDLEDYCED